jgi:DNA-binding response OmpR family regulator
MRILVVEDDADMRDYLKITLERESFIVDCAPDGQKGSYMARTNDYDMVLLDNMLPNKTGIEVCKDVRQSGKNMPIILLSVKSEADEKAALLDSGADDYLTKPYSHKELLARMRALMRRAPLVKPTVLKVGDVTLDTTTNEVRKGKKEIYLTRKEFGLLELLMQNKGNIVSRGAILEHVWDSDGDPFSKTIETHILNLRKKIENGRKRFLINVPGRGYKISAEE